MMMMSLRWLGRCRPPLCNMGVRSLDSAQNRRLLIRINGGVAQLFHTSQCHKFKEDKKTTALAIIDSVKQVRHSPTPALALGLSGLIPFVAAPIYMATSGVFEPDVAQAQLFYGASILSFLGGVRWGLTLPEGSSQPPDWHNLGYSVTPSLIAWIGLLVPHSIGMLIVIAGLGLAGYMDLAMWGYPTWFKGMRFCLTFVAVLSLWTSFVFKFILDDTKVDKELDRKSESQ